MRPSFKTPMRVQNIAQKVKQIRGFCESGIDAEDEASMQLQFNTFQGPACSNLESVRILYEALRKLIRTYETGIVFLVAVSITVAEQDILSFHDISHGKGSVLTQSNLILL